MYLVELRPGKEELYRSVDELAAAIRSGDVDAHSRIFHRATSKWISITLHPQFKAIAAAKENEPLPPPLRKQWTFLTSAADELEQSAASSPEPEAEAQAGAEPPTDDHSASPWRRPFTLGLAGLLLILGAQLAFSVPRPQWARFNRAVAPATPATQRLAGATPSTPESMVSLASNRSGAEVGYPLPEEAPADAQDNFEPPVPTALLPHAPALQLNELPAPPTSRDTNTATSLTVETLIHRYNAAYDSAGARLASAMRLAQLQQLLSPARLTTAGDVSRLRLNVAGVTHFIRAYREQEREIEAFHQDSFAALSKHIEWSPKQIHQWYGRVSHRESAALVALTDTLLSSIDSVLGVLAANAGAYQIASDSITFDKLAAVAEYGRLRQQVEQHLHVARTTLGGASAGVMAALLSMIGTTRLPTES